jgi:putative ABC transport system permease protein
MHYDIRLALRTLAGHKAFFAAAVTTLALGIGTTTAMFSVAYGVLLRPLPYAEAERLVHLSERHPGAVAISTSVEPSLSNLTYYGWNGQGRTIGPIGTYGRRARTVGMDEPTRIPGASASPALFDVLRVSPALGRFFTDDDVRVGAAPVVILSDSLWRERFGASPDAIDKTILIDYTPHRIVGIAPPGFAFPDGTVRYWTPGVPRAPGAPGGNVQISPTSAIARLLPGASAAQAAAEGTAIARSQPRPPFADMIWGKGGPVEVQVRTMADKLTAPVRPVLLLFLAGAVCLLLIACANVVNLLLSRGAARERELAVMLALGASRSRVTRQLLIESLIIALAGGAIGVPLAMAIVRALPAFAPVDFPRLGEIRLDWTTAAFASVVSLLSGLAAGSMPALRSGRQNLLRGLRGTATTPARHTAKARRTLLVAEASLAMLLLVVATLVGRSFGRLLDVDPGYDPARVLTARVFLPWAALRPGEADQFAEALLVRLRAVPSVQAAGGGWMTPFGGSTSANTFTIAVPGREAVSARSLVNVVTPGYAEALRLRLRAGRLLTDADRSAPTQSLVVNQEFVRTFLAGVEPVGFNVGVILSRGVTAEVVGVVNNVLKDGLQSAPAPEVYVVAAHRYTIGGEIKLVVRTDTDPIHLAGTVRQLVRDLRSDAAVDNVLPLTSQLSDSVRTERLAASTLGSFATIATLLAALGLYGVVSYSVSTRQREIGIRAALGASRRDVVALVVRDGMGVAGIGLTLGLIGGAVAARVLQSQIAGIQPADGVAFVIAPAVLTAVTFTACLLPARRAVRMDPAAALRHE